MRIAPPFLVIFFMLSSCSSNKQDLQTTVTGNWLVLYPDHRLKTRLEQEVYGRYQDSLINLYGLKMISLKEGGDFSEIDSLLLPGAKWVLTKDSLLKIREGGRGFNPLNTTYKAFADDTLQLTQYLPLEGERIKVVWHLKKITDDHQMAGLFTKERNAWRVKPSVPEKGEALRKRLVAMLNFYGDYFILVSKESIYFSPARIPLPFQYYQHAVGMSNQPSAAFKTFFYNEEEANKAIALLEQSMTTLASDFPRDENFVVEYGLFLKKMAKHLDR